MSQNPKGKSQAQKDLKKPAMFALLAVVAVALAWIYWPRSETGPAAAPEVKEKAAKIAEQVRKAEGNPPPEIPQPAPTTPAPNGPKNLRKGGGGQ